MNPSDDANPLLDNPLLGSPDLLPRYDRIRPEHVEPAIRALLPRLRDGLAELERTVEPTWASAVERTTALTEPLGWAWGVVNHLMGVQNGDDLRRAI